MDYNLRDLKFFETVADLGHLGRAAQALGRSQPALTKCIRRLEASVGSPLFAREGRGIKLTPVGGLLREKTRELLRHAEEVERELGDFSAGSAGHVRIGGGLISADDVIPEVCARILAGSSGATFDIVIAANVWLREELREGRIDLLLGLIPLADPDFITVALAPDIVVPAARRAHPIFRRRRYRPEILLEYAWAVPSREIPSRQWLDTTLLALGHRVPTVHMETNSPPLLPRIIESTDLIAFLPRRMLNAREHPDLREIAVPELTFRRDFGVTYSRHGYLSPAAQRVLDLLINEGRALFRASSHGRRAQVR